MKSNFAKIILLAGAVFFMASCSSSKKYPSRTSKSRTGKVIVIDDARHDRTGNGHKDNGKHKGWTKNTNNPHHPQTTNPGHTKHKKGKPGKTEKQHKGKKH